MKKLYISVYAIFFCCSFAFGHEGMWLPSLIKQLNESDLQKNGFKLTAEDIYSVNKSSMKDAVVWFNKGCTGEVVSGQGLVLTNHHCGFGQIQSHSTLEHDYLKDGFVSKNLSEELPNNNLQVSFIVRIEDVTDKILTGIADNLAETERAALIAKNIAEVSAKTTQGTHYEALIKPFFYGNQYYMFVLETFTDVRLVFAPPSSIGKFGGDTDNWEWPRHTGDFSVFRIYADKNNKPAAYSPDNVPYKPKHHFPISLNGVKPEDFTMVYGFPGRTQQYLPSFGVEYVTKTSNPVKIAMRDASLDIIGNNMKADNMIRIKYAAKQARIANAWKKWIGENKGLERLDALNKKQVFEKEFLERAKGNKTYTDLIPQFETLYGQMEKYNLGRDLFIELLYYGPEVLRFSDRFEKLTNEYGSMTSADLVKEVKTLSSLAKYHFKNYDHATDKEVFRTLSKMYSDAIAAEFLPDLYTKALKEGSFDKLTETVYTKSVFASEAEFNKFFSKLEETAAVLEGDADNEKAQKSLLKLAKSAAKKVKADPAYVLVRDVVQNYVGEIKPHYVSLHTQIENMMRTYVKGIQELFPDKKYWSDANSTLRMTYGKVEGSEPKDGVIYLPHTTLKGVIEKRRTDVSETHEFYVSPKLIELYNNKDYGMYADEKGDMVVCFTGSNHTTGGNSGSPVINGEGQLIGINFDRTWQSTMSDIMFDPVKCRNIVVDIRYVLFVIDKFGGARHLVDEMSLVKQ